MAMKAKATGNMQNVPFFKNVIDILRVAELNAGLYPKQEN